MTAWAGQDGSTTAARWREMGERQARGVSASYERLCLGVADDAEVLARLDTLPAPKRQPNLVLAAVRFLDGPVDRYASFRAFLLDRWDDVAGVALARRTQTNEARRCATLLPALASVPGPVALVEVGASAGLCLQPDRYAYRYVTEQGDAPLIGSSPLVLRCAVTGPAPLPTSVPDVVWRAGLDLHPLDVTDPDAVRWLRCLVWPEHAERRAVLAAALAIAAADPPPVRRGDLLTDLRALVAAAPPDATLVVQHSAVLAYLDAEGRADFDRQVRALAAERPTVRLASEAPGVVVDAPGRPPAPAAFVVSRDDVPLAWADPHGAWLTWLERPSATGAHRGGDRTW